MSRGFVKPFRGWDRPGNARFHSIFARLGLSAAPPRLYSVLVSAPKGGSPQQT